jgi:hypothetical protein
MMPCIAQACQAPLIWKTDSGSGSHFLAVSEAAVHSPRGRMWPTSSAVARGLGDNQHDESWLSGITNMVKPPAIYRLSPIYHVWHFWCDFCNFFVRFLHFLYYLGAFFLHCLCV